MKAEQLITHTLALSMTKRVEEQIRVYRQQIFQHGKLRAEINIETLEKINVPIYKYGTQITIHGNLPDVKNVRVAGYKALFKNQNGSIGVKYVAIDGKKKKLIVMAYNLAKSTRLGVAISSTGLTLQKRVSTNSTAENIAEGRKLLASVPECFVGRKYLCKDMFGCIWVEIDVGSIYWKDLFIFIDWLTFGEIRSEEDVSLLKQKREEKRAEEKAKAEEEYAIAVAEEEKKKREIIAQFESEGFKLYHGEKYDGLYILRPMPGHRYLHIMFKTYGKRFKKSSVETDSKTKLDKSAFVTWKNPTDPYSSTVRGFLFG